MSMNEDLGAELRKMLAAYLARRKKVVVRIKGLEFEKKDLDNKIKDLNKAFIVATGKPFGGIVETRRAADLVEELLWEFGELHVDTMLKLMSERRMLPEGQKIQKQSLVAMLVRYVQQNKRFRRVEGRPNTFALIKEEEA